MYPNDWPRLNNSRISVERAEKVKWPLRPHSLVADRIVQEFSRTRRHVSRIPFCGIVPSCGLTLIGTFAAASLINCE